MFRLIMRENCFILKIEKAEMSTLSIYMKRKKLIVTTGKLYNKN